MYSVSNPDTNPNPGTNSNPNFYIAFLRQQQSVQEENVLQQLLSESESRLNFSEARQRATENLLKAVQNTVLLDKELHIEIVNDYEMRVTLLCDQLREKTDLLASTKELG
jgi:hypothetical protein